MNVMDVFDSICYILIYVSITGIGIIVTVVADGV